LTTGNTNKRRDIKDRLKQGLNILQNAFTVTVDRKETVMTEEQLQAYSKMERAI